MTVPKTRFMTPVAVHLFLIDQDRILLLRRYNTGYEDGNYSVIAGHLDGEETVLAAMCREAREEAGIELDADATHVVGVMHRISNDERIDFFIMADHWTGEARNLEPDKCDELRWTPVDRLPDNTIPYVASAIATWRRGEWFSMFGWDTGS